ncbi:MAG TPA: histone deacetylase family protein [Reyranella sp.]|nr:histone deacetylase family protein [Reyranella sp.]
MTTLVISHPACLDHEPGEHHPESPHRLRAVMKALDDPEFAGLKRAEAPLATEEQLARVHPRELVRALLGIRPEAGELAMIDGDTMMSTGSAEAAARAAGAVVAAVDAVVTGQASNAFAAVRPPGHHASATVPSGFCLFNNVVIGARHAQAAHGLKRLAIVDFDVHHGNGTQAIAETDPDLFFASTHQYPFYPGTGSAREHGIDNNVVNVPLAANSGSKEFRAAWGDRILPALDRYAPELIVVSAGFDAHRRDPLAQLRLETDDFRWVTEELLAIAKRHTGGRLVSSMEGGYDLEALADSAAAHVGALMRA